jgi:hypothetical protein
MGACREHRPSRPGTEQPRKLGQLGTQVVVNGFVESDPDHAALALGQPEPLVEGGPHMYASADQPAGAVRAADAPSTQLRSVSTAARAVPRANGDRLVLAAIRMCLLLLHGAASGAPIRR